MSNILKRPKVSISDMKIDNEETKSALTNHMKEEILFEAETIIKYSGYINRQKEEIDKIKVYENMIIPEKFNYNDKIGNFITKKPFSVDITDKVEDVTELVKKYNLGQFVVLDQNKVLGILDVKDIV